MPFVKRVHRGGTRPAGLLLAGLLVAGLAVASGTALASPGSAADPWGDHRAVFTAAGTVNSEDWGLTWNLPLPGGGLLVSKEIRLEIGLEAVLQP
jgi:hypothetical protein